MELEYKVLKEILAEQKKTNELLERLAIKEVNQPAILPERKQRAKRRVSGQ